VDADTEANLAVRRESRVRLGQSGLRFHRTLHGVHCTAELGEDTVARRVCYAAPYAHQ